jgi:DNA-binding NarL/FixJ family response regulator
MVTTGVARLLGRRAERAVLDRLLECVRGGRSGVLVVVGEAGIGKTALLDYAAESAFGFRVVRTGGVESEMELPFAALHQLCAPMLDRRERLPGPQRDALRVAFGLSAGHPPDRFLVALAVLSLLAEAAKEQRLLVVVDDTQWLDGASAQALAFVARRLLAEPLALVFATREPSNELTGLPELHVEGLGDDDARALLGSVVHARLDEGVEQRVLAEARGNPLALLELPRGFTTSALAGGFGIPVAAPLSRRIEESFHRRLVTLPADTRQLLVIVAAEPVGDPVRVWRAAELLGIRADAAEAAEAEDLLTFGARATFRHPVVRSVVYQSASLQERRAAHRALAHVTDPRLDPDRRAWHRAHAAPGPDEEVASELVRSASRAQARGGLSAAAAFLEKAAVLTLEPARRAERALAAAQAKHQAGAFDVALGLLATAEAAPLNELQRAQVDLLRAQIAFARTRGSDTPSLLSAAAKRLEPLDPGLARETHLEALWAAVRSGRFAKAEGVVEAAQAATLRAGQEPSRAIDLLLEGVVARLTRGYELAAPTVARALAAFRAEGFRRENIAWCWLGCQLAMDVWDDRSCEEIVSGLVRIARERGGLTVLPFALNYSAAHQLFIGEFGVAEQLVKEAEAITAATRNEPIADFSVLLAAWRGDRERTYALREAAIEAATERGEGFAVEVAEWAATVLHNGLGDYTDSTAAAERACGHDGLGFGVWVLPELIEAAVRSGDRQTAEVAFERLAERSSTSATEWARGVEAAARALLSEEFEAEELYLEAIEQLGRSRVVVLRARAHLLYGEWLRRERRKFDARRQLRQAHELFQQFGAEAFAERARVELNATGERARKRTPEARDELTPQEAQIARLAAEGETNKEIAAQLFISASTVDYHLRKAFCKLGVKSRSQLARHVLTPSSLTVRAA